MDDRRDVARWNIFKGDDVLFIIPFAVGSGRSSRIADWAVVLLDIPAVLLKDPVPQVVFLDAAKKRDL